LKRVVKGKPIFKMQLKVLKQNGFYGPKAVFNQSSYINKIFININIKTK